MGNVSRALAFMVLMASAAMCMAFVVSLRSMTVLLLTSLSSSILLTNSVMRLVLSMIFWLISRRVSSFSVMLGEVSIWVKPERMFSGVRISWEICWMNDVFMRDDS